MFVDIFQIIFTNYINRLNEYVQNMIGQSEY